ncbi:MAG: TIGR04282 family arsenosugar biosynthesis glycosyltransferase [Gammaproteobacteria bacterium]|nr:TIGR04282 family arsenosugar biosynthesis glycosyltransferase [Gammaproteobacteria bacterium]
MSTDLLYPDGRIMVFCKAPEPGRVKTRLAASIGDAAAATVHEYLAWHCLNRLARAAIAPVELWCTPDVGHDFFRRCAAEYGLVLKQQTGECLGQRMEQAFSNALSQSRNAVVVGTDCPTLDTAYIRAAFAALEQQDAVLGPAEDGGYVLLGLRKPQPPLFADMPWGTSKVLAKTRSRLTGKVKELSTLWDIDDVDDLRRLRDSADELALERGFSEYLVKLIGRKPIL